MPRKLASEIFEGKDAERRFNNLMKPSYDIEVGEEKLMPTPGEIKWNAKTKPTSITALSQEDYNSLGIYPETPELGEEKLIFSYIEDFDEKFGTLGSYNENIKSFLEKSLQSVYKQGGLDNEVEWINNEKNWCEIVEKKVQEARESLKKEILEKLQTRWAMERNLKIAQGVSEAADVISNIK